MHVALDLGAGSGRAFVGGVDGGRLLLQEVHRFHYAPRHADGHLRWDVARLYDGIVEGLKAAGAAAVDRRTFVRTIGVDSWGVDYGLFHTTGRLLESPISYRDARTTGRMAQVLERVPRALIFERTGIQFLPINTLYQLAAHVEEGLPVGTARLLMMADLCHHFLSGSRVGELTNASTTQLLNARTQRWDDELFLRLGLPRAIMPELVEAGTVLGPLRAARQAELGGAGAHVVAPATHDTASAVAGTPLRSGWAYISSGTWSLVGVERGAPLITPEVADANFTNEVGAFATIRFLRNVMGLWLLESCRREWGDAAPGLTALVAQAAALPPPSSLIFPDDPRFLNPPSMVSAIRQYLFETGQTPPDGPAACARVILDSLALRYAAVLADIERLTGEAIHGLHIVGGGSQNAYLNQATADASGRPVLAGPVEATAAGNILVQAVAAGGLASLAEGRELLARTVSLHGFAPRLDPQWDDLRARYAALDAGARQAPHG